MKNRLLSNLKDKTWVGSLVFFCILRFSLPIGSDSESEVSLEKVRDFFRHDSDWREYKNYYLFSYLCRTQSNPK